MASDASPQPSPMDVENDEICWICLDENNEHLMTPCKCPRKVHPKCLARWQLQQAGKPEETHCRFCNHALADWKSSLTPDNLKPDVQRVQPIMVVYFEGQIHRIPVKQGSEGLREFTDRIRELFRLPEDIDISLTFGCKEPMSGNHLKLEGIGAFDAAVHCASVAAAERQQKLRTTSSGGGAVSSGGSSNSGAGTPPALSPPSQQSLTGPATPNGQPQVAPYAHHHRRATTSVLPSVDHASLAAAEQQLQLAHQQHAARAGIPTLAFPPLPPVQQHAPLPLQHHSMHQLPSQIGAADSYGTQAMPQRTRARSNHGLARTVSAAAAIPDSSLAHAQPPRGHAVSSFVAASAVASAADPSAPLTPSTGPAPAPRGVFSSITRRRMHFSASRASSSGGSSSDAAADMGTPFFYDPQSTADDPCASPMDVDEQPDSSSRASSREADSDRAGQRIISSPRTSHRTIDSSTSDSQHSTPSSDDNTVAVGSLTGRLKYSLKAFSRKVARSLTLRPTAGGPAPPAAGSPIGAATVPDACL